MSESITVTWSWQAAGDVLLVAGKLAFPEVPNVGGVYRFTFFDAAGEPTAVYVGEADLLQRRFRSYRTPGSSQQTNLRMNPIMTETLRQGGRVAVAVVTRAQARIGHAALSPLDLTGKAARVLIERAAEVAARQGDVPVLNR